MHLHVLLDGVQAVSGMDGVSSDGSLGDEDGIDRDVVDTRAIALTDYYHLKLSNKIGSEEK